MIRLAALCLALVAATFGAAQFSAFAQFAERLHGAFATRLDLLTGSLFGHLHQNVRQTKLLIGIRLTRV